MFNFIKKAFKQTDKLLLTLCLLLSLYGTLIVASATLRTVETGSFISRDAKVMLLAVAIGFAACIIVSFIDYDILLKLWPVVAAGSILLMLLLFPFGAAPEGRESARSWLKLVGSLYLQPSEILKIAFIITFSYHTNRIKNDISSFKNVILLCLHAFIPIVLVVLTGDLGSAFIFALMFVGMLFVSGVHWLYFPAGLLAAGAVAPLLWFKVFDNIQRSRFLALFNPDDYPKEIYQQLQSRNAMRRGGFLGTGLFNGPLTQSGSIPMSKNDMAFSVVCEELGFVGAMVLLLLFALLAVRIVQVGKRSNNFAASMLCHGVMFMLISQVVVNVGMCLMLLPVIGITLPFISAGGSSVVCTYVAVGLVLSVYRSSQGLGYYDYRYDRMAR